MHEGHEVHNKIKWGPKNDPKKNPTSKEDFADSISEFKNVFTIDECTFKNNVDLFSRHFLSSQYFFRHG